MFLTLTPRYVGGLLALLTALTVAGCAESGGVAPQSLPSLSAAIGPSTAPTAPRQRPVMSRTQQELLTVRRYFTASNSLAHDMDPSRLSQLFTATCPCDAQATSVRRTAASGEHFVGRARVNALRPSSEGPRRATVLADYDFSRGGIADRSGRRLTTTPAKRHIEWVFDLRLVHGRWLINRIDTAK